VHVITIASATNLFLPTESLLRFAHVKNPKIKLSLEYLKRKAFVIVSVLFVYLPDDVFVVLSLCY